MLSVKRLTFTIYSGNRKRESNFSLSKFIKHVFEYPKKFVSSQQKERLSQSSKSPFSRWSRRTTGTLRTRAIGHKIKYEAAVKNSSG